MMTEIYPARPSGAPSVRLAIYDMDKTITHMPTWTPFLLHTARTSGARGGWRWCRSPAWPRSAMSDG
ncbi:hypothetical protein [Sphingomonas aurantiaca]|uniref:hypothetical protein n=1 Tax=Sphingomonas aurantiaca TaxID=185949 RepID=UPI002FDFC748